jgi:hypothetical protein
MRGSGERAKGIGFKTPELSARALIENAEVVPGAGFKPGELDSILTLMDFERTNV